MDGDRSPVRPTAFAERLARSTARQVSGGELQRFALARARLLDPAFLFADEARLT
ncbi:ATP-binding cassette domain-containing protein (plasmid) [Sinorhizobium meliloti]|nr:ATP-binding cassette domain-containing protein [Sinorhizobium meliloti]